jgi:hypothetical protein
VRRTRPENGGEKQKQEREQGEMLRAGDGLVDLHDDLIAGLVRDVGGEGPYLEMGVGGVRTNRSSDSLFAPPTTIRLPYPPPCLHVLLGTRALLTSVPGMPCRYTATAVVCVSLGGLRGGTLTRAPVPSLLPFADSLFSFQR